MKEKLETLIKRILMKKFPVIENLISIVDVGGGGFGIENVFVVRLETSKVLSDEEIREIMEELYLLFTVMSPKQSDQSFSFPSITCLFHHIGRVYNKFEITLWGKGQ